MGDPVKLTDFRPGVAVGAIKIGMTVGDVQKALGDEDSRYPVGREYDRDIDDEHFLCWKKKGIEIGVDSLDGEGLPTAKSRVVSIHVKGQEVTNEGCSVGVDAVEKLHGKPNDTGEYTAHGGKRRSWCCYNSGLQATYDKDGWLVSLCVAKVKQAAKAAGK
jgi:hypothetical protein